ncbi:KGK domain-containing protein [Microcystis aeruginosa CS-555/01A07]|uniref:KGK domain-containing protein n=1 Tax=Microcystis aeruginosa TaxID=1126 RepID=UPI002330C171|nr:KGK domain-containing protein [Microcystis aeruginosa]MDB9429275.1 KGK domain-containing protein [Microcystis aeruginosa CS-555/01A07]
MRKFREKIQADLLNYIGKYTSFERLRTDMQDRSSLFGQINKIEWVHYPSEGKDCKLLIRGEKEWRTGKVKIYGECTFSSVLEKLPKKTPERPDYDGEFLRELQNQEFEYLNETRQIKIILEFIPENRPLEQESESPLDEIRMLL